MWSVKKQTMGQRKKTENSKIYLYRNSSASISEPRLLGFLLVGAGLLVLISPWIIASASSIEKTIAVGITVGLIVLGFYRYFTRIKNA
jgi:hypothetical protein